MAQNLTADEAAVAWSVVKDQVRQLGHSVADDLSRYRVDSISAQGKIVFVGNNDETCNELQDDSTKNMIINLLSRELGRAVGFHCIIRPKPISLRDRVRAATPIPRTPIAGPGRTLTIAAPDNGAIRTAYKGVFFRSRLEARWAAFFDEVEESWEFEPEGYELPCGRYLPDFWLSSWTHGGTFWEVKPTEDAIEIEKIEGLVSLTGKPCNVSVGPPWDCHITVFYPVMHVQRKTKKLNASAKLAAEKVRGMSFWEPS